MEKVTLLINDDFESILICAIRYAIGRRTYMPHIVCDFIQPLVPQLSDKALHVINSDIFERGDDLGDPNIDAPHWLSLKNAILKEKERRKANGRYEAAFVALEYISNEQELMDWYIEEMNDPDGYENFVHGLSIMARGYRDNVLPLLAEVLRSND